MHYTEEQTLRFVVKKVQGFVKAVTGEFSLIAPVPVFLFAQKSRGRAIWRVFIVH